MGLFDGLKASMEEKKQQKALEKEREDAKMDFETKIQVYATLMETENYHLAANKLSEIKELKEKYPDMLEYPTTILLAISTFERLFKKPLKEVTFDDAWELEKAEPEAFGGFKVTLEPIYEEDDE